MFRKIKNIKISLKFSKIFEYKNSSYKGQLLLTNCLLLFAWTERVFVFFVLGFFQSFWKGTRVQGIPKY